MGKRRRKRMTRGEGKGGCVGGRNELYGGREENL
jgi:hypothetical protein